MHRSVGIASIEAEEASTSSCMFWIMMHVS